jgi:hypothetical protein
MKRKWQIFSLVLLLALLPLLLASATAAFDLSWWSVDGGGGKSTGGGYTLQGAAGQADAGQMRGGNFSLSGGYLVEAMHHVVFLPHLTKP